MIKNDYQETKDDNSLLTNESKRVYQAGIFDKLPSIILYVYVVLVYFIYLKFNIFHNGCKSYYLLYQ